MNLVRHQRDYLETKQENIDFKDSWFGFEEIDVSFSSRYIIFYSSIVSLEIEASRIVLRVLEGLSVGINCFPDPQPLIDEIIGRRNK